MCSLILSSENITHARNSVYIHSVKLNVYPQFSEESIKFSNHRRLFNLINNIKFFDWAMHENGSNVREIILEDVFSNEEETLNLISN